ncbi:MAG: efflux RND transporter permease subunit, partial [Gammaproteobacteria bacterium]|nr:efflux RND transporter permease subunit [Gammaproteobacteria bacterium]
ITIRYPENIDQFQALRDILIPNQRGGLVPLSKIVKFEQSSGFSTIRHKDGVRVLSVTANIDSSKITSIKLNKLVADAHADWVGDAVGKVDIKFGGEAEKNAESMRGLAFSFLFAMVGIFFILALQFNNFSYPLVVMLAIPFGVIGIIVSFYLHNAFWHPTPLSFFAFMGMVALSGVVVNSSLVLLVFIQRALQEGVHYVDAILQAGRRRLRAVVLTSATTVFGLLPTAYGWGGSDPFVAPMALALAWGLIFATLITLLMIPAIYAAGVDVKVMLRAFLSRFQKK